MAPTKVIMRSSKISAWMCANTSLKRQEIKALNPVLVFDRGFARARYVIKFLDEKGIRVVMRVPRNVGVYVNGSLRKL